MSAIKENYLKIILKEIRFPFDRKDVRKELEEHFDDSIEFYLKPGVSAEEAERLATQDFGDPIEIGKALNQVHKPLLGWLWFLSKYGLIALSVIALFLAFPRVQSAWQDAQESKAPTQDATMILSGLGLENGVVVLDKMLDQRVKLKDATIIVERVIVLQDGTLFMLIQQVDRFDPFGLKTTDYPLRTQGSLLTNDQKVAFRQSGVMGYEGFTVLIADGIPATMTDLTFVYQGYSESFTIELELDHD